MKQTMIDHVKTIGYIVGVIAALAVVVYLMVMFEKYIIIGVGVAITAFGIHSVYSAVYKEVKASRKRKENTNVRKNEE